MSKTSVPKSEISTSIKKQNIKIYLESQWKNTSNNNIISTNILNFPLTQAKCTLISNKYIYF